MHHYIWYFINFSLVKKNHAMKKVTNDLYVKVHSALNRQWTFFFVLKNGYY